MIKVGNTLLCTVFVELVKVCVRFTLLCEFALCVCMYVSVVIDVSS